LPAPTFLASEWLLACFHPEPERARHGYRAFVERAEEVFPWEELRAGVYLGSEGFAARLSMGTRSDAEIPQVQRAPVRPRLPDLLLSGEGEHIAVAHKDHGYRLNEIAAHLGVHYATVSRRLRTWEEGRPCRNADLTPEAWMLFPLLMGSGHSPSYP
jgi:putative transposase